MPALRSSEARGRRGSHSCSQSELGVLVSTVMRTAFHPDVRKICISPRCVLSRHLNQVRCFCDLGAERSEVRLLVFWSLRSRTASHSCAPPLCTGLTRERLLPHCSLLTSPRSFGLGTTTLSRAHGIVSGSTVAFARWCGAAQASRFPPPCANARARFAGALESTFAALRLMGRPRALRVCTWGRRSRVRPPVCARLYPPRSDARKQMQGMIIRNGKLSYRSCLADSFRSG